MYDADAASIDHMVILITTVALLHADAASINHMVILRRQGHHMRQLETMDTNKEGSAFLFDAPITVLLDNLSDRAHLLTIIVVMIDADAASIDRNYCFPAPTRDS